MMIQSSHIFGPNVYANALLRIRSYAPGGLNEIESALFKLCRFGYILKAIYGKIRNYGRPTKAYAQSSLKRACFKMSKYEL